MPQHYPIQLKMEENSNRFAKKSIRMLSNFMYYLSNASNTTNTQMLNTRSCSNMKSGGQLKLLAKIVLMTNLSPRVVGYGFKT